MSKTLSGRRTALQRVRTVYQDSALHAFCRFWQLSWQNSGIRHLLVRIFSGRDTHEASRATGCMDRFNARLGRCDGLQQALYTSRLWRVWNAIARAGRESRLTGWIFREGVTGVFLFLIGIYTLIDYFLRDVLSVPVLSSGWDEALLLLGFIWVLLVRVKERPTLRASVSPLDLPVLFFLGVSITLFIVTVHNVGINITGLRATIQYIFWFFVITRLLRSDRQCMNLYLTLVVVASIIALHGVYQYIVAAPIPSNWTDQAEASVRTRVYSIFGSPNIMGDFMVMFAPMTAALAYYYKDTRRRLLFWGLTFVMCFSCLFTMSRGAWVALAVAILVFAVLVDRRLLLLMLGAAICAMFLPFVASRIGYLFTAEYAASAARGGRAMRWAKTMEYLFDIDPVFGMGYGIFGGAVAMQNQIRTWMSYFYTDNYYVKILAENGFVGLGAFLVMILGVLWTGLKGWFRQRHTDRAVLQAGMYASICGVLVHCYFENIFEEPYMAVCFWTICSMSVYWGFLRDRLRAEPAQRLDKAQTPYTSS